MPSGFQYATYASLPGLVTDGSYTQVYDLEEQKLLSPEEALERWRDGRPSGADLGIDTWTAASNLARIVRVPSGEVVQEIEFPAAISVLRLSSDGKWLAALCQEELELIHLPTKHRTKLRGHDLRIRSLSFSHDSRHIVTGSLDRTIRIWDVDTQSDLYVWRPHKQGANVRLSPDGDWLVTFGDFGSIWIWNAETLQLRQILHGHSWHVEDVDFSSDGQKLVSTSEDRTIRVWDWKTGRLEHQTTTRCTPHRIRLIPDSQQIVVVFEDNTLQNWDYQADTWTPIDESPHPIFAMEIHPHKPQVAHVGLLGIPSFVDMQPARTRTSSKGAHISNLCLAYRPDGGQIGIGGHDQTVSIYDTKSGDRIAELHGHTGTVRGVHWTADLTRIISLGKDETLRIWDAQRFAPLAVIKVGMGISLDVRGNDTFYCGLSDGGVTLVEANQIDKTLMAERRIVESGKAIVETLADASMLATEIRARLEADPRLDPAVLDSALTYLNARGDVPLAIYFDTFAALVNTPPRWDAHPNEQEFWQRTKQRIITAGKNLEQPILRNALAMVNVRCGDYAEALVQLKQTRKELQLQSPEKKYQFEVQFAIHLEHAIAANLMYSSVAAMGVGNLAEAADYRKQIDDSIRHATATSDFHRPLLRSIHTFLHDADRLQTESGQIQP